MSIMAGNTQIIESIAHIKNLAWNTDKSMTFLFKGSPPCNSNSDPHQVLVA